MTVLGNSHFLASVLFRHLGTAFPTCVLPIKKPSGSCGKLFLVGERSVGDIESPESCGWWSRRYPLMATLANVVSHWGSEVSPLGSHLVIRTAAYAN
jgi:hypothetical protein